MEYQNYEMAALLYEYGADPKIVDPQGLSALNMLEVYSEEEFLNIIR